METQTRGRAVTCSRGEKRPGKKRPRHEHLAKRKRVEGEDEDDGSIPVPGSPGAATGVITPSTASEHPFEADPRDHAETPFQAYRDIAPLLRALAQRLYGSVVGDANDDADGGVAAASRQLRIYDPYFCEGSMVAYLARLGFTNVYNRNEDFYGVVAAGRVPDFDVLVTNPPFSGDHMERIVRWAEGCGRPWLLLMPDFVANKPYYHAFRHRCTSTSAASGKPVYIGPTRQAYVFAAPLHTPDGVTPLVGQRPATAVVPAGLKRRAADKNEDDENEDDEGEGAGKVQVLPAGCFQCVWFVHLGEAHAEAVLARWHEEHSAAEAEATIASEARLLPQLTIARRPTPAERRWRKKQRRLLAEGRPTSDAGGDHAPMITSGVGHQGAGEGSSSASGGRRGLLQPMAVRPDESGGVGRGHQRAAQKKGRGGRTGGGVGGPRAKAHQT
ncbi:uncharacterized protein ACA1_037140 [Acanthamoeba castellanii str. Neff]|uniref:Uncharacterized protein n=1 Tax=Acanthamoeba castellanii (strain ATCC 30010 / Neff) TaxID=1257118 RepID=L8H0U8_ACACF|nr:uncharacterized protein ACA1_037140 [Acanthamoeba castellanii str. Neff]ELR18880.1 hypothetical protein ACA1_037140 [Acanthamoeba castellanii str. Neff]